MQGKSTSAYEKEKPPPCSDLESGLKPIIGFGKLLLAFPRLRLNLEGDREGLGAWLFRLLATLVITFSILIILFVNAARFSQIPVPDRQNEIFRFAMEILSCLSDACFFYVSAYRTPDLRSLVRSHRDFEGKLAGYGLHPRPFYMQAASIFMCILFFGHVTVVELWAGFERVRSTGFWFKAKITSGNERLPSWLLMTSVYLDQYYLPFYWILSSAFIFFLSFPLAMKFRHFNFILMNGKIPPHQAYAMHLELMELVNMTQDILSPLILWVYPDSISYLVDVILRIVCVQHIPPRNVWKLLFHTSRILLVTYGLVKVHDEAHRPASWIHSQLKLEPNNTYLHLLLEKLQTTRIALSGAGLFHATRPLLATVFGVICTFTIVRFQFYPPDGS